MDFEDEIDTDEYVTKFRCWECKGYFDEEELDTVDCSHWEEYHGHRTLIDDYRDCCPACGGDVHKVRVRLSELPECE